MAERAQILSAQERSMRWAMILDGAGLAPFFLAAALSGSMVLWTDAMDYVRAFLVALVAWKIVRGISRGQFQGYDYGAEKVQSMAGIAGSLLYIGVLIFLAAGCVNRIIHPTRLESAFSLAGAGLQLISASVDTFFWIHNRRLSKKLFSPVLEMNWRANRVSALLTLSMALGLVFTVVLHEHSWSVYIDPVCALVFICIGMVSFLPAIASDLESLSDKTLKEELQLRIDRRLAENFRGYSGFHGVRSRRSGGRIFIEIALSFPADAKVADAVRTTDALREGIQNDISGSEVSIVLRGATAPPSL